MILQDRALRRAQDRDLFELVRPRERHIVLRTQRLAVDRARHAFPASFFPDLIDPVKDHLPVELLEASFYKDLHKAVCYLLAGLVRCLRCLRCLL